MIIQNIINMKKRYGMNQFEVPFIYFSYQMITRPALDRFHDSSKVNALVCFISLCSMLYALCSMLYALRSTLYALRFTLYAPRSTLHALRSTLYAPRSTLHALRSMLYALRSTLYALCSMPTHAHTCPSPLQKIFYDFI